MKNLISLFLLCLTLTVSAQSHFYDTAKVTISIAQQKVFIPTQGAQADSIKINVSFLVIDTLGSPLLTLKVRQIYKEPNPLPANFPTDIAQKVYIWVKQVFPSLKTTQSVTAQPTQQGAPR